jgi:hypothetical protein
MIGVDRCPTCGTPEGALPWHRHPDGSVTSCFDEWHVGRPVLGQDVRPVASAELSLSGKRYRFEVFEVPE